MNARLRILGPSGDRLALSSRPLPRAGFAFLFLVLLAAFLLNFHPVVDLAPSRLPLTVFYLALMGASLTGALVSRRIVFDRGRAEAVHETRVGFWTIASAALPIPRSAEVRVRREGEGVGRIYVLEVARGGEAVRIEAGPWRSLLEPLGREMADFLGVPFRPAGD